MTLNKIWHTANRMPPNPDRNQRIRWHIAHAQACGCRPAPESLRDDIEKASDARWRKPKGGADAT